MDPACNDLGFEPGPKSSLLRIGVSYHNKILPLTTQATSKSQMGVLFIRCVSPSPQIELPSFKKVRNCASLGRRLERSKLLHRISYTRTGYPGC
jgi:hypothetical protein